MVAVGIALRRRTELPKWLAIGVPASWILMIPFSAIGGGFFAGAFWMTVAYLVSNDALGETAVVAEPVGA